MATDWQFGGMVTLGVLTLHAVPAAAEVRATTHEIHIFAGKLFGDDLTDTGISGRRPELDDDTFHGFRYGYNITDAWGVEASVDFSPTSATGVEGGDIDLDLTTLDVDAIWHFNTDTRWAPYLLAGAGYAWADLDGPITGSVNGRDASVDDDSGFTLNAGGGVKFFATGQFMIRFGARYRYLDTLTDKLDDSLNTYEATLGIGWRF
jgi:outer membrane beta-barrel protein